MIDKYCTALVKTQFITLLVDATLLVNYSHKFKLWVGFISL